MLRDWSQKVMKNGIYLTRFTTKEIIGINKEKAPLFSHTNTNEYIKYELISELRKF